MEDQELIEAIFFSSTGILFLISILLFVLYYSNKKLGKEKLNRQRLITKHQEELLIHSIETQELERDRLASEIHDAITSKLNALNIQFMGLENELSDDQLKRVVALRKVVDDGIEDSRRIAYDLFPVVLEKFGLKTAIEELRDINTSDKLKVFFETNIDENEVEQVKAVHIYRVLQELIQNSIKHARASQIEMSFFVDKVDGVLNYSDNGRGSVQQLEINAGMGMKNIRSRMAVLKGNMEIEEKNPGLKFRFNFKIK